MTLEDTDSHAPSKAAHEVVHDLRQPLNVALLQLSLAKISLEKAGSPGGSRVHEPLAEAAQALRDLSEALDQAEARIVALVRGDPH